MKIFFGKFLGLSLLETDSLIHTGELSIPAKVHTIGKKSLYGTFYIKSVKIPLKVKTIEESAFENCVYLLRVVFEDSSMLTSIGDHAFENCSNLVSINIPLSVLSIGYRAFRNCSKMQTVVFEEDSYLKSIGTCAFLDCESLAAVVIPKNVARIGEDAFANCPNLTIFCECENKPAEWKDGWNGSAKVIWGCERTEIDGYTYVYGKCDNEIYACLAKVEQSVSHFKVHETIKGNKYILKGINLDSCANNKNLVSITVPNCVTALSSDIFRYCYYLETVKFEKDSKLKEIGPEAFRKCTYLKTITIPSSVNTICPTAFGDCTNLETINFEEGSQLNDIRDGTFWGCDKLKSITIPSSVSFIRENVFWGCKELKTIIFEKGTKLKSIGKWAFEKCDKLKTIIYNATLEEWKKVDKKCGTLDITVKCLDGEINLKDWNFTHPIYYKKK